MLFHLMSYKMKKQLMMQIKMIEIKKSRRETQMAYIVVAFTLPITNDDNPTIFSERVHNIENNLWKLVIKKRDEVSLSKSDLGTHGVA